MAKYEAKTKATAVSVTTFLKGVKSEKKRQDALTLIEIMRQITKHDPVMWGPSIIGFGKYHYTYASGHEGECAASGFSPRSTALTLYISPDFPEYPELMKSLGKYTAGKCCIYVKSLDDLHLPTLKKLIRGSHKYITTRKWP
jgi:hypothetical protein